MTRYFIITGLNEGKDISPYVVETDGSLPYEIENPPYGDCSREAREISKKEYNAYRNIGESQC